MTFSSKLLLFGEHTILRGSAALALPLPLFSGKWAYTTPENAPALQRDLAEWCQYLAEQQSKGALDTELDTARFKQDLQAGLYFDSNIPNGYGAGSSGALCAALYTRYALQPIGRMEEARYPELKRVLSQMESFFHGSSSGTDPLIVYLNQPVLLHANGRIETIAVPDWPTETSGFQFFLLNTGIQRSTAQWVNLFLKRCTEAAYLQSIQQDLIPLTAQAIAAFRAGDWPNLFEEWANISALQQVHFAPMIPESFHTLWAEGLNSGHFALKLCGAGGGGFLLGMGKAGHLPPGAIILA
ncbi:mevalonate kinase [Haliscomenobacter sp.]|uniref:mevalonate kinase family protein n=1 Tax=Haliscomenobacter sp. TaxID=2717303 RepID=UPI0035941268